MASEFQIKNGLILGGLNSQVTTFGLTYNPSTGRVGYMSTASFASGSGTTGTSGAGTAGYIAKWDTGTSLNNSVIYQDGTNIAIGAVSAGTNKLYIAGTATITGDVALSSALTVTGTTKLLGTTAAAGAASNVLMINTSTGQLYHTASSAIGGGGAIDTSQFATTGSNTFKASQIISGSLTVTSSVNFSALTASASLSNVVMINPGTGQLYYTASSAVGGVNSVTAGNGLTGTSTTGNLTINVVGTTGRIDAFANSIDLVTTGVSAGTYTAANITVDAYGRVTGASNSGAITTLSPGNGGIYISTNTISNTFGEHEHEYHLILDLNNTLPTVTELLNTGGYTINIDNPAQGKYTIDFGASALPAGKTIIMWSYGAVKNVYGPGGGSGMPILSFWEFDTTKPLQNINIFTYEFEAGDYRDNLIDTGHMIIKTYKP